jgi:hypothetical protein
MDKNKLIFLPILSLCLLAILALRFNRNIDLSDPTLTIVEIGDAAQYIGLVFHFRGEAPRTTLLAPFIYRPLVPMLAALLPFEPHTAINLINSLALVAALWFLYLIMAQLGIHPLLRLVGCELFIFSLPVLYFAVNGYVDAVLIGLLTVGFYCILTNRYGLAGAIILLGCLAKETVIILFPVWLLHAWLNNRRQIYLIVLIVFLTAGVQVAIRIVNTGYPVFVSWAPSWVGLKSNLVWRDMHLANCLFVFGPAGFLALVFLFKRQARLTPHLAGLLAAIALTVYAATAAALDGRFSWTTYPFSIPLAMLAIERIFLCKAKITWRWPWPRLWACRFSRPRRT